MRADSTSFWFWLSLLKLSIMIVEYKQKSFHIKRYPETGNRSLRAWNAADEFLLDILADVSLPLRKMLIVNDRFGFLSALLHDKEPFSVISYKSQERACALNLIHNRIQVDETLWVNPLEPWPMEIEAAVIKIPKSMELFRFYLHKISQSLTDDGVIYAAFMTRFFTPKMVSVAKEYFEEVEQTKAWKKSRVMVLQKKRSLPKHDFIHQISMEDNGILKNYPGVFSAHSVDTASRLLIENMQLDEPVKKVLDLASGNGVLAVSIVKRFPEVEMHLLDDYYLAVESSKLNINGGSCYFHYDDTMDGFESDYFDLIVSNPPFHFEYETNIEVSLSLFKGAARCLKPTGLFQVVANRHLNYKTHLVKLFEKVVDVARDDKFVVYNCLNSE